MPLNLKIKDLHRNHKKSTSDNLAWYDDNFNNKNSTQVYKIPANHHLKPGKIYRFYYNPKTIVKLPYYDMNPLVLSLGSKKFKNSKVDLCLNLNYFPYPVKVYIINTVYKTYKNIIDTQIRQYSFDGRRQKYYDLTHEILMSLLSSVNINFGIRNYSRENRLNAATISYENMYRLPFIEQYKFMKKGVQQVHSIYRKTLKK